MNPEGDAAVVLLDHCNESVRGYSDAVYPFDASTVTELIIASQPIANKYGI